MAEQNVALSDNLHRYAMQLPLNNQGDSNNLISDDTEYACEEAIIESDNPYISDIHPVAISVSQKNRLLVPVIFKHWEPPK